MSYTLVQPPHFSRVFPISLTIISIYNRSKLCIIHCMQIFKDLNQQWLIHYHLQLIQLLKEYYHGDLHMTIICNRFSILRKGLHDYFLQQIKHFKGQFPQWFERYYPEEWSGVICLETLCNLQLLFANLHGNLWITIICNRFSGKMFWTTSFKLWTIVQFNDGGDIIFLGIFAWNICNMRTK